MSWTGLSSGCRAIGCRGQHEHPSRVQPRAESRDAEARHGFQRPDPLKAAGSTSPARSSSSTTSLPRRWCSIRLCPLPAAMAAFSGAIAVTASQAARQPRIAAISQRQNAARPGTSAFVAASKAGVQGLGGLLLNAPPHARSPSPPPGGGREPPLFKRLKGISARLAAIATPVSGRLCLQLGRALNDFGRTMVWGRGRSTGVRAVRYFRAWLVESTWSSLRPAGKASSSER